MTTPDLEALRRDVEALGDELTPKEKAELLRDIEELERHVRETPPPPKPSLGARVVAWLARLVARPVRSVPAEVDPLAEAEIYLSYGRIDQALEILEQAQKARPERQDIIQKLRALRLRVR